MRRPGFLAGAAIALFAVVLALMSIEFGAEPRSLLARYLLTYGPGDEDLEITSPPAPPGGRHPLGTDIQRRDYLSRVLHGAKISVQVGLTAEAIALVIGVVVGALSGFYRGWVEALLMRGADILLAFPLPILAMAAIAVFETRSIALVFVVLGLMGWAGIARLVRAQCLSVSERGYAEAARALGAGDVRLITRHLLPNATAPALVAGCVGVAGNILTEAWLSFLGLGVQPPAVSWGRMIADARDELTTRPWLCIYPGVAVALTVMAFLLLADGLRDSLDPRARVATQVTS